MRRHARRAGGPARDVQPGFLVAGGDGRPAVHRGRGSGTDSGSAEIVDYGELETDIREITRLLPRQGVKGYPSRWFAIKLLEQDSLAEGLLASVDTEDGRIAALIRQCRESWATRHGEDMVRSIAHARFAQARDIAARCSERLEFVTSVTEKVDAVLCHRFWGPLILLGILFVFYQASVTLGNYLAAQVWPVWGKLEVWAAAVLPQQGFLEDPVLTALGLWIVKSITAVLNYLPIFVIMFALVVHALQTLLVVMLGIYGWADLALAGRRSRPLTEP